MKTATMDFGGQRETIAAKLAAAETALETVSNRIGALSLDVTLGLVSRADLDKANAERSRLQADSDALTAALAEVDRRETAAAEAEAAKQRQADEKRLASLQHALAALGAKVIEASTQLGAVLAEGSEASAEAEALARRLDVSTVAIAQWPVTAAGIVSARGLGTGRYTQPGELQAAERAIAGKVVDH